MKLTKLIPSDADAYCQDMVDCPAVYTSDGDFVVVQGAQFASPSIEVPAGDGLVTVPKTLVRALATQLAELQ